MMDCSHHYCSECGVHHGFDHEPGCQLGKAEAAQQREGDGARLKKAARELDIDPETLAYERGYLAAEVECAKRFKKLEARIRWYAEQAAYNRDAFDLKAAEVLTNIANEIEKARP